MSYNIPLNQPPRPQPWHNLEGDIPHRRIIQHHITNILAQRSDLHIDPSVLPAVAQAIETELYSIAEDLQSFQNGPTLPDRVNEYLNKMRVR